MQTYQDHPYAVILRSWGHDDKDTANRNVHIYLDSKKMLTQRELEALALLDLGNVMKLLTRWFGTQLAPVARAHLVHEIKTNRRLVG